MWYRLTNEEIEQLNPPPVRVKWIDDTVFLEQLDSEEWINVGHIPRPETRYGWFVYNVIHGLAMRYPFKKILGYAAAALIRESGECIGKPS